MSELSHQGAQRLIYKRRLSKSEQRALHDHLQNCESCRQNAAIFGILENHLALQELPTRPSPRFSAVYREQAARRSRRSHVMKPIYAVGGLAALALIVLAGWFIVRANPETNTLEAVPVQTIVSAVPETQVTPAVEPAKGLLEEQLVAAVEAGDAVLVEQLLDQGANPNSLDDEGNALLPIAAKDGELEIVQHLLDAGAEIDGTLTDTDVKGATGLILAAGSNHNDVVRLLIANGADLDQVETSFKRTALHIAAWINNAETVTLLLESGADPNPQSIAGRGETPLHFAAYNGSFAAVQALLDGGADVDSQTDDGETPMMDAEVISNSEMVRLLLEGGANPDVQDNYGSTALHVAAYKLLRNDSISLLIEHGASLDLQNNAGNTALHNAVERQNAGAVSILIEHGADVSVENNKGQTVLDVATNDEIIEMLRQAGAGE